MNARIGSKNDDLVALKIAGRYWVGERNENGKKPMEFLCAHDLFLANTAFLQPIKHPVTWKGYIKIPEYEQAKSVKCQFQASSKTELKIHMRTVHEKIKLFICNSCSFTLLHVTTL